MDRLTSLDAGPNGHAAEVPVSQRHCVTVSELNRAAAALLERGFPLLWVAGEISNFTRAASGHWYFTLKDARAQVRCVMFRGRNQFVEFAPREGDRVEARGTVSLYEARGEFQLGVEALRRAGEGDLFAAFQRLKERLAAEGLFDAARKRAPPAAPRTIGIVTSPHAAALHDVLTTLARRAPRIPVILYPTPVQGADAPARVVAALKAAAGRAECDVLLLVRGGGALEDLQAFNDEAVARAIVASPIPVIAGIGHETDFTIADFVADVRAPTPTGAATLASPDGAEQRARLRAAALRLAEGFERRLDRLEQHVDATQRLLRSPLEQHEARRRRLEALAHRLAAAQDRRAAVAILRLRTSTGRLRAPPLDARGERLSALGRALGRAGAALVDRAAQRLAAAESTHELVSPRGVLARGYAIVRDPSGAVVRARDQAPPGVRLSIELGDGRIRAEVVAEPVPPTGGSAPASTDRE